MEGRSGHEARRGTSSSHFVGCFHNKSEQGETDVVTFFTNCSNYDLNTEGRDGV